MLNNETKRLHTFSIIAGKTNLMQKKLLGEQPTERTGKKVLHNKTDKKENF